MYTLRIIDQTKIGAEERRNIFIGNEYSVLMRTPHSQDIKEGTNKFENELDKYYGDEEPRVVETIVGFVYANNVTYPIRDYNVVYIVGNEGQTIERVYGHYEKY